MKTVERHWNRKDRKPEETIQQILDILERYSIKIKVINEYSYKNLWFSINIEIDGLDGIFTNGKGISREYAYASALAELMERLQNNLLLPGIFESNDLEARIDEKFLNHLCQLKERYVEQEITEFQKEYPDYFKGAEFLNLIDNTNVKLPIKLIEFMCGSNGACAGNTKEEAIVQGASELFERYALKTIYFNNTGCFPIIHESCLEGKNSYSLLCEIKKNNFDFEVVDLSLNNKIPVIGLVVYNRNKTRYAFACGSDINFDICLQRCITEMFQGKNFDFSFRFVMKEIWHTKSLSYDKWSDEEKTEEYIKTLMDNSGYLPFDFFGNKKIIFNIPTVFVSKELDNKMVFQKILHICKINQWDIFVKDSSFLGFPSYRVYIPDLSEAFITKSVNIFDIIKDLEYLKYNFRYLYNKDVQQKKLFCQKLNKILSYPRYKYNYSISKVLGLIFARNSNEHGYLHVGNRLLFYLLLSVGDYQTAVECLLNGKVEKSLDQQEILDMKYLYELEDKKAVAHINLPMCPNCEGCGLKGICGEENIIKIGKKCNENSSRNKCDLPYL